MEEGVYITIKRSVLLTTPEIPFKHKDIEEASHDKRFKPAWECVAFRLGAMWAINKIYSYKTSAEILEEIEAPIVTYD